MKKLIFAFLVISPVIFCLSCEDLPSIEKSTTGNSEVRYTEDWKFVTVYLGVPEDAPEPELSKSTSRAMTADTARMGFDFFEVVFYAYGAPAKRYWEVGQRVYIYDVYSTPSGIDYSRHEFADAYAPSGNAAILFAGRKRDKTLLAVGKVYSVDDEPGALVKSSSSYVTFELFPLKASVSYKAELSSFTMAYDTDQPVGVDNTLIVEALIGGKSFPLYKLPEGKASVQAEYRFELEGAEWDDFSGGIIVGSVFDDSKGSIESGSVLVRNPRYPAGAGNYWYALYPMDLTTEVKMLNNQKPGWTAENPVKFEFNTEESTKQKAKASASEIGLFTLAFRIPVRPLLPAEGVGFISPTDDNEGEFAPETGDEIMWFIRPAYQSYYYNIDNGADSTGGGVLMGVFDIHLRDFVVPRRKS